MAKAGGVPPDRFRQVQAAQRNPFAKPPPAPKAAHYGWRHRFKTFYSSPVMLFWLDVMSFFSLLGLYTAMVLIPLTDTLSAVEYATLAWFAALTAEEFRQMVERGPKAYSPTTGTALTWSSSACIPSALASA